MTPIYLIIILIIISSIVYLYKPIRKLIQQKTIYSSCFKTPKSDYIPIFGHLFSLAGQISKRDNSQCGFVFSSGKKWKTRRRIITPSFHNSSLLANCIGIFNEQLNIGLKHFQTLANQQVETDLYPLISAWTLDVICETAMGKTVRAQTEESEYVKAVVRITELITLRMRSPWLWPRTIFKLSAQGREHDRLLKIIHKFTRQVIEDRIANFSSIDVRHRMAFLDTLIAKMNDEQISIDDVQEEVDTFMFAGHDTTATAINFALFMIALHQDIQQHLFEEIQSIFQNDNERACTLDDVQQMNYLECVIKETLRLLPSVPMIGREIQETFQYDGKTFLKGTTVVIFIYEIHRDPQHFPEPEKFDPDRFLPELTQQRHPYAYIPFSAGSRNCIGQRFALLEEKVFLSTIIRRFHLTTSQTYNDFVPTEQIILRSDNALKVKLISRA
ncbi:unnamed protein product [Rotaria sordida]|uniref:Cytochrome P450 n=1 Tax=Rotaria sordida TaxID=392033 RepID=A0A819EX55_9BILA|nr:unnamed protein product [Rotaria sordida]CAF3696284.1 unnamed protein product [Rotaria sordida]CAF3857923.1 unnamed protein product [Rotaria sordida]